MMNVYPKRAPNAAFRVLGGEAIVMNPLDSSLFSLNETAAAIWRAADGCRSLAQIVDSEVCGQFDVDPETALREATEFAEALAVHDILILLPEAETEVLPWRP